MLWNPPTLTAPVIDPYAVVKPFVNCENTTPVLQLPFNSLFKS